MKKIYQAAIILVFALSCKPKHKSFDKIYFVAYNRPLNDLPDDFNGQPPIFIHRFVEIGSDGTGINGYRNSYEDSSIHFHKLQLSENSLDSLNDLATNYVNDKSFLQQDPSGTFDSYFLRCLLIESENENVLIEFWDNRSIPDNLKQVVFDFWKLAQEKHQLETTSNQFYSFQKKLDGILLKRSKLLPPPIKTIIKFLPPKVDSLAAER